MGLKQGEQLTMPMARDEENPDLLSGQELKAIDIRSHWKDLLPIIYSNKNVQNMMEKSYQGKYNKNYGLHYGLCLEPQLFPDAINQKNFKSPILTANDTYISTISMKFRNDF